LAIVTAALEGTSDIPVVRKLLDATGHELGVVHGLKGKTFLNANIHGYNNAAKYAPWLVVRDMDHDAPCPGELASRLLPQPAAKMLFRIAVREVESWILADPERLAVFLSVTASLVPQDPDALEDPKEILVNLARRSRRKAIRDDMTPTSGASVIGPAYGSRVAEFATAHWRPNVAALRSPSLRRCMTRLSVWRP
jgi:hypothetical protein